MNHVSIELAKQLKDAGPVWEPKRGDFFATCDDPEMANIYVISGESDLSPELGGKMWFYGGDLCNRDGGCRLNETFCYCMNMDGFKPEWLKVFSVASARERLWLPREDQLRAEIEKHGYKYKIEPERMMPDMYACRLGKYEKRDHYDLFYVASGVDKTSENATGYALLWILSKEKEGAQNREGVNNAH